MMDSNHYFDHGICIIPVKLKLKLKLSTELGRAVNESTVDSVKKAFLKSKRNCDPDCDTLPDQAWLACNVRGGNGQYNFSDA